MIKTLYFFVTVPLHQGWQVFSFLSEKSLALSITHPLQWLSGKRRRDPCLLYVFFMSSLCLLSPFFRNTCFTSVDPVRMPVLYPRSPQDRGQRWLSKACIRTFLYRVHPASCILSSCSSGSLRTIPLTQEDPEPS